MFTEATVPPGLLRSHRTAPGTWGLICVLEGRLLYRVLDPLSERVLDPAGAPGLVEPGVPHEVAPLGPVRFQVEFYRRTGAAGQLGPGRITSPMAHELINAVSNERIKAAADRTLLPPGGAGLNFVPRRKQQR